MKTEVARYTCLKCYSIMEMTVAEQSVIGDWNVYDCPNCGPVMGDDLSIEYD